MSETPSRIIRPDQVNGPEFDVSAPMLDNFVIDIGRGGVQAQGHRALAPRNDAVTIPFPQLFQLIAQVHILLSTDTPAGRALRAHIGTPPPPGFTPPDPATRRTHG